MPLVRDLPFPFLAINGYDKTLGEFTFPPSRVVGRGRLRIGIAAPIADKTVTVGAAAIPVLSGSGCRYRSGQ